MNFVLVTGANGFIGRYLVKYLLQKKINVKILVRNIKNASFFPKEVEIFVGDLTQPKSLMGSCKNIDTVFHLGGYAHAMGQDVSNYHHQINFLGTQHIVDEAVRENVKKFIFFSSVKAVGDQDLCTDETWMKPPNTAYGIAKRSAEKIVLELKNQGVHVCILRPALVYGPQWKGNLERMFLAIKKGLFLPLPKVNNRRSMVSLHDICEAAFLAAITSNANGKIYFVTDNELYSTHQIYSLMYKALGKPIPIWHVPFWVFKCLALLGNTWEKLTGYHFFFDSNSLSKLFGSAEFSSQQIQRDLDFKPSYTLEKMLPLIIEHDRNFGRHGNQSSGTTAGK